MLASFNIFFIFNFDLGMGQNSSNLASFATNRSFETLPTSELKTNKNAQKDLLEKYRSEISYRVNEETDKQLKEIDQWLFRHLEQEKSITAGQVMSDQQQTEFGNQNQKTASTIESISGKNNQKSTIDYLSTIDLNNDTKTQTKN